MTKEEFILKFQGRMLVFLTEAWCCRKESPTDMGRLMDDHARLMKQLLRDMYDSIHSQPAPNGTPAPQKGPTR